MKENTKQAKVKAAIHLSGGNPKITRAEGDAPVQATNSMKSNSPPGSSKPPPSPAGDLSRSF